MKCTIPEISWHNREPVLSVDIHPVCDGSYKLASAGADFHILIWQLTVAENGAVRQEVISDLTRHQRAVNCVRWSPTGQFLASADDDANIIVWQRKTDNVSSQAEGETSSDKESLIVYKILRGHKEDVYDMTWSLDEEKLFSGSVDNTAILWDIPRGKVEHILAEHRGFVQGVSWDPKNQFIATMCTDRICRIFDASGKHVRGRLFKGSVPVPDGNELSHKEVKFFHDDTFKSFFRRLQFTPDGSMLIVPSGYLEAENAKTLNATLLFALDNLSSPVAILPLKQQSSTVVRCCPVLFRLRDDGPAPAIKLPYRMVFAVGTDHDIILYDTQQPVPFARFQEIHYTRLTDLTWSQDGRLLVASSTDGFCALVTFDDGELGEPFTPSPLHLDTDDALDSQQQQQQQPEEKNDKRELDASKKRTSFLKQWTSAKIPKTDEDKAALPLGLDAGPDKLERGDEKKRPSLMEQWVLKSPKLQKNDEKINVLIPKRTKTTTPATMASENLIRDKNDEEKINRLTPKRAKAGSDEIVKISVPSLIQKKNDVHSVDSSPKGNVAETPLIAFLKSKSTGPKSEKKATAFVDLTLDETEACDIFAADECPVEKPGEIAAFEEDTCPEDFVLQLEESQDAPEERETCRKPDIPKETKMLLNKSEHVQKVPRRVPFITLSSPKRLKKL